jgi:hypothetical protein
MVLIPESMEATPEVLMATPMAMMAKQLEETVAIPVAMEATPEALMATLEAIVITQEISPATTLIKQATMESSLVGTLAGTPQAILEMNQA